MQGGSTKKKKKICTGGLAKKIKYVPGVGEKIKICEGGSAKFSIPPPPHRDLKWNSP